MERHIKVYENKTSFVADLSLLIVALLWGGGFVALKDGLNGMDPLFLLAIRFTTAFIIMTAIFYKKFKLITRKDIKAGMIIGFFVFLSFVAQIYGLKYTTVSKQAFLVGTNVIMVPLLVWMFYKKRPNLEVFISAMICCFGIGLLTTQGDYSTLNKGDLLSLICAVCIAVSYVAISHFASDSDPIILTIIQIGFTTVLFIIIAFTFEPIPKNISKAVILSLFYLVFLATIGGFLIQNVAQKYTSPTHTAIILSMESVFGALFAAIMLNERMTIWMIIGCILIMVAIFISEMKLIHKRLSDSIARIMGSGLT